MLHIKSAQYMQQQPMLAPKPLPEAVQQHEMSVCKLCQQPAHADDLDEGFCQECLASGMVYNCVNCGGKNAENEMVDTEDGKACGTCTEDLYQGHGSEEYGRGYSGPRRTYHSGPTESY